MENAQWSHSTQWWKKYASDLFVAWGKASISIYFVNQYRPPTKGEDVKNDDIRNYLDRLWKRLWPAFCCVAVLGVIFYVWYDYRFPSWKEDVVLNDGRKITVKERRDLIDGYGTRKTWLTFSLPEMGGEQTWEEHLMPTMMGVSGGKVYVVGRPRGDKQFRKYSYPKYVYVAFVWSGKNFERIPFLSVPLDIRKEENIRWCAPGGEDSRNAVQPKNARCVEKQGEFDKYPRPRIVDLQIRTEEAKRWAELDGYKSPISD